MNIRSKKIHNLKFITFLLEENKNILKILNEVAVPQLGVDPRNKNKINVKQTEKALNKKELSLWEKMKKNWKKIALAAAGVGIVGVGLYGYYNSNKIQKINNDTNKLKDLPTTSSLTIPSTTTQLKDKIPLSNKENQEIKKVLDYAKLYINEFIKNYKIKSSQLRETTEKSSTPFYDLSINSLYQLRGFITAIKDKLSTTDSKNYLDQSNSILEKIGNLILTIQKEEENIAISKEDTNVAITIIKDITENNSYKINAMIQEIQKDNLKLEKVKDINLKAEIIKGLKIKMPYLYDYQAGLRTALIKLGTGYALYNEPDVFELTGKNLDSQLNTKYKISTNPKNINLKFADRATDLIPGKWHNVIRWNEEQIENIIKLELKSNLSRDDIAEQLTIADDKLAELLFITRYNDIQEEHKRNVQKIGIHTIPIIDQLSRDEKIELKKAQRNKDIRKQMKILLPYMDESGFRATFGMSKYDFESGRNSEFSPEKLDHELLYKIIYAPTQKAGSRALDDIDYMGPIG